MLAGTPECMDCPDPFACGEGTIFLHTSSTSTMQTLAAIALLLLTMAPVPAQTTKQTTSVTG
jgi:hypothetical protein